MRVYVHIPILKVLHSEKNIKKIIHLLKLNWSKKNVLQYKYGCGKVSISKLERIDILKLGN